MIARRAPSAPIKQRSRQTPKGQKKPCGDFLEVVRNATLGRKYIDAVSVILQTHGYRDGGESDRIRFMDAFLVLAWSTPSLSYRHALDPLAIPVPYDALEPFYGEQVTPSWAVRGTEWSKKLRIAKAFKPKLDLHKDLDDMKTASTEGRLVRLDEARQLREVRAKRLTVVMVRRQASAEPEGFLVAASVPVDVDRMRQTVDAVDEWISIISRWKGQRFSEWIDALKSAKGTFPAVMRREILDDSVEALNNHRFENRPASQLFTERLQNIRRAFKATLRETKDGMLPHRYHESPYGRIYGSTGSLMNVPKIVRRTALHGCVEYDMHACQFAALRDLGNAFGVSTSIVSDYVESKEERRNEFADRIGRPSKEAKDIINGVGFGAGLGISDDPENMGMLQRKYDDMWPLIHADEWLLSFQRETREIQRRVLEEARGSNGSPNKAHIQNCRGLFMPARSNALSQVAFMMQGIEALMLEAALRAHTVGQDKPLLAIHDAWVTREYLDIDDVTAAIRGATSKHLGVPISMRLNHASYAVSGL